MQWLQSVFGSDGSPIVQYVTIFAVIFAVLTVIVLVVRRLGGGRLADAKRSGQRGRQPRLGIVDVYELDRQRQLILLRRDNVEHLLLVGGPNDVVIERNIQRGQPRDPSLRPEASAEPLPDALPDLASGPFPSLETRAEAAFRTDFAMPVVLAAAVPGSQAAPPVARPLDLGARDAAAPLAEDPSEPPSEAVVAGPRPEAAGRRPMRRTAPPLINPRPDVASERLRPEPSPHPESPAFDPGAMPPMAPAERRAVDPAILSDMARQLEAALARPASAVTPPPARPATEMPAQVPGQGAAQAAAQGPTSGPDGPAAIDPMAAAMAAPAARPAAPGDSPYDALFEAPVPPEAVPAPEPFLPAPPRPAHPVAAPVIPSAPAADPAPPPVEPVPAPAAPKSAANPFSVEEIEAEFARLLGRPLDKRN